MLKPVTEYLREFTGTPYVVQFTSIVNVEGHELPVIEISSWLIPASSKSNAIELASQMVEKMTFAYRNREGEVVSTQCKGIHHVEELTFSDPDGTIPLSVFCYSRVTQLENLLLDVDRSDLPLLDQ